MKDNKIQFRMANRKGKPISGVKCMRLLSGRLGDEYKEKLTLALDVPQQVRHDLRYGFFRGLDEQGLPLIQLVAANVLPV